MDIGNAAGAAVTGTYEADRDADLALLREAVREAGALALGYFGNDPRAERKQDGTEVSEADIAVNDLLHERLAAARPSYGWLSEETEDTAERLSHRRLWVVDPIDGTRAFLKIRPEWTVSVALVESGRPVLAAVFNPAKDAFYHATAGGGAYLSDAPIRVIDRDEIAESRLAVGSGMLRRDIWTSPWPQVETRWVNSIAYRLALVASGDFHAVISLTNKNDWDLAAADLLVQEAGGTVTTHRGAPFMYNRADPRQESVLAAGPALHARLLERTASVRP